MTRGLILASLIFASACLGSTGAFWERTPPKQSIPVLTPPPKETAAPTIAPAPSRAQMLTVRADFCNLVDEQGRTLYNPLIEDVWVADHPLFVQWMQMLRDDGATHVILHVGEGGQSYHGDGTLPQNIWPEPDHWSDLPAYMRLLREIADTPSASGAGFTSIVFLDDGGPDPLPRIRERWPRFFAALASAGLSDRVIVVPAFEPVVGDWSSAEVSEALQLIDRLAPDVLLGYHGSPRRLVGSSHPVEPDDPWQGAEAGFYRSHGGEHIDIAFYQTEHGAQLYRDCDVTDSACEKNRLNDYVLRIGAGYHGWRKLPLVILETTAYEAIRGRATPQDAVDVGTRLKTVCEAPWADDYTGGPVACGWGNGLPSE
jgi:hypothetical protein